LVLGIVLGVPVIVDTHPEPKIVGKYLVKCGWQAFMKRTEIIQRGADLDHL
jgi:hypothetical protein